MFGYCGRADHWTGGVVSRGKGGPIGERTRQVEIHGFSF